MIALRTEIEIAPGPVAYAWMIKQLMRYPDGSVEEAADYIPALSCADARGIVQQNLDAVIEEARIYGYIYRTVVSEPQRVVFELERKEA